MAYNFIGEPPEDMMDPSVDHIDRNILNNYYKNLRWLERSENSRIARLITQTGSSNNRAKLNEKQVEKICELLMENKLTLTQISNIYNVSIDTISSIRRKLSWTNISTKYDFPIKIKK